MGWGQRPRGVRIWESRGIDGSFGREGEAASWGTVLEQGEGGRESRRAPLLQVGGAEEA